MTQQNDFSENQTCLTWRLPVGTDEPELLTLPGAPVSTLDQASMQIPGGAYTTFRTFRRVYAFHLADHFARLENSSRLLLLPEKLDATRIRHAIFRAIQQFQADDTRIRLSLDLTSNPGDIYISLEKLIVPSRDQYEHGIHVATVRMQRQNPQAKSTSFISQAAEIRSSLPKCAVEGIMLGDDGAMMEGLSSNFYSVIDGEIYTSDQGILCGVTRRLVLDEARRAGIVVKYRPPRLSELPGFSESFITSSSRAVMPVIAVDQTPIGDGNPGPVTTLLLNKYTERIDREIEPIWL